MKTLQTIGTIAARLGVATHQITYAIRRNRIVPIGRAGIARVFDERAVSKIAAVLKARQ